jgi:hypothetical protein
MDQLTELQLMEMERTVYQLMVRQREGEELTPDQADFLDYANTVIERTTVCSL